MTAEEQLEYVTVPVLAGATVRVSVTETWFCALALDANRSSNSNVKCLMIFSLS
jgi:hypothetical protein